LVLADDGQHESEEARERRNGGRRQLIQVGDKRGSFSAIHKGSVVTVQQSGWLTVLALVDVAQGDTASARSRLDRLERDIAAKNGGTSQDALWLAMIKTALGEDTAALERLERVPNKSAEFAFWLMLPEFDALRDNPRFQKLFEETRPRIEESRLIARS
jgi:hypothetical protein